MFVLPQKNDILFVVNDREKIIEAIRSGFLISETAPAINSNNDRDTVIYVVEGNCSGSCAKFILETIEYNDGNNKWFFKKNDNHLLSVSYVGDIKSIPATVFAKISSINVGEKGYGFFR